MRRGLPSDGPVEACQVHWQGRCPGDGGRCGLVLRAFAEVRGSERRATGNVCRTQHGERLGGCPLCGFVPQRASQPTRPPRVPPAADTGYPMPTRPARTPGAARRVARTVQLWGEDGALWHLHSERRALSRRTRRHENIHSGTDLRRLNFQSLASRLVSIPMRCSGILLLQSMCRTLMLSFPVDHDRKHRQSTRHERMHAGLRLAHGTN